MKICPQCNKKYENDLNFCLDDGSVLSKESFSDDYKENPQSNDSEDTLVLKDTKRQARIKTEVLPNLKTSPNDSDTKNKTNSTPPQSKSKALRISAIALVIAVLLGGMGFAAWKVMQSPSSSFQALNKITKEEMELLLKDFNPMQLKQLAENPDQKKQLVDNISELLAIASQAQKDGLANDSIIKTELKSLEESVFAINYDKKINADKGSVPPFEHISDEKVKAFWDATDTEKTLLDRIGFGENTPNEREKKFQAFIDSKLELARKNEQLTKNQEPTAKEFKQARDAFAKTQIYYNEVNQKLAYLHILPETERKEWEEFKKKAELQTKLQQAQFLSQSYVKEKFEVTDKEIEEYIRSHPELTTSEKKRKLAEEVLDKVKKGEDFAKLAKQYSEDPGSKNNGGLYEGIAIGQFTPEFEKAALALEPGEFTKELVETNFGYHIIKLEKKGEAKGVNGETQPTFDARHILISTMVKDTDNPTSKEIPAKEFAKTKLKKEKQENLLKEIKANNPIEVAQDFEVPKVSDEELEKFKKEHPQSAPKENEVKKLEMD